MEPNFDLIKKFLDVEFTSSTIGISENPTSSGKLQAENLNTRVSKASESARASNPEKDLKTLNDHTEVLANLIIRLKHGEQGKQGQTTAGMKAEALYKRAMSKIAHESSSNREEIEQKCLMLAKALENHLHNVNLIKAKELLSQIPIDSGAISPKKGGNAPSVSLQASDSNIVSTALSALTNSTANVIKAVSIEKENAEPNLMGRVKTLVGGYLSKSPRSEMSPEKSAASVTSPRSDSIDGIQDPHVKNLMMGLTKSFKYDLQINPDGTIQVRERINDASDPEEVKLLRSPAMQRKSEFTLKVLKSIVAIQNGGAEVVDPKDPDRRAVKDVAIKVYGILEDERRHGTISARLEEFLKKAGGQFPASNQLLHNPLIVEEATLDKLNNQPINSRHAIDIARFINSGSLTLQNHKGKIAGNDKKTDLLNLIGVLGQTLGLNREQYVEVFRNGIKLGPSANLDEESLAAITNDILGEDKGYQKGIGRILNACAQGQILGSTAPLQMLLQLTARPKLVNGPATLVYIDTNPDSSTKGQIKITQDMDVSIDPKNPDAIVHVKMVVISNSNGKFLTSKTTFAVSPNWKVPSDADVRKSLSRIFQESGYNK